jgi:hypothetical protein
MRAFFVSLHLEQQVGCSPSTLRAVMEQLEALILETTEAWEREGITQGQIGPIVGTVDETFLQRMMWVFMDLISGYVLLEEVATDRTYETWYERVTARLEPVGQKYSNASIYRQLSSPDFLAFDLIFSPPGPIVKAR